MTITPYNQNSYLVSSTTRDEVEHLVDLETLECSCEAALDFATRSPADPCKHVQAALAIRAPKNLTTRRTGSAFALLRCQRTSEL